MDLRAILSLPAHSTDADVVAAVAALQLENEALKRRLIEEGTDLYNELALARKEIAALADELRSLKLR